MEKISIARRRMEKAGHGREPREGSAFSLGKRSNFISPCSPVPPVHPPGALAELLKVMQTGKNRFSIEIIQGSEPALHFVASISPVDCFLPEKKVFTADEASKLLRVNKKVIYRELKKGSLKGLKIGRQWRIMLDHN